jgi:phage terminase large subunit
MVLTCDCAEPKSIADLQDIGLKATKCHKEPGCVQYRIKWLQHRRIIIDPERTPVSAKEFSNYCYVVDKATGEITSALPDKDNHTIDSCAYALDKLIYSHKVSA